MAGEERGGSLMNRLPSDMGQTAEQPSEQSQLLFHLTYRITSQDFRRSLDGYDDAFRALQRRRANAAKHRDGKRSVSAGWIFVLLLLAAVMLHAVASQFSPSSLTAVILYAAIVLWIVFVRRLGTRRRAKDYDNITDALVRAGELERPECFELYSDHIAHSSPLLNNSIETSSVRSMVERADGIYILYYHSRNYIYLPARFFHSELLHALRHAAESADIGWFCQEKAQLPEYREQGDDFGESFRQSHAQTPLYYFSFRMTDRLERMLLSRQNRRVVLGVVACAALMFVGFWVKTGWWLTDALCESAGAIFLLRGLILARGWRRSFRLKKSDAFPNIPVEYRFYEDCFRVVSPTGVIQHGYGTIKNIRRYGNVLFLLLWNHTYLCVPREATPNKETFAMFQKFIQTKRKNS